MPLPKGTKKSDAKRRADSKYSMSHYSIVAAKLRTADADAFKRAAASQGTTVNAILTACALDYIAAHDPGAPDQTEKAPD